MFSYAFECRVFSLVVWGRFLLSFDCFQGSLTRVEYAFAELVLLSTEQDCRAVLKVKSVQFCVCVVTRVYLSSLVDSSEHLIHLLISPSSLLPFDLLFMLNVRDQGSTEQ